MYDHLLLKGLKKDYIHWNYHGQQTQMRDDYTTLYNDDEKEERINEEHVSNNDIHVILA